VTYKGKKVRIIMKDGKEIKGVMTGDRSKSFTVIENEDGKIRVPKGEIDEFITEYPLSGTVGLDPKPNESSHVQKERVGAVRQKKAKTIKAAPPEARPVKVLEKATVGQLINFCSSIETKFDLACGVDRFDNTSIFLYSSNVIYAMMRRFDLTAQMLPFSAKLLAMNIGVSGRIFKFTSAAMAYAIEKGAVIPVTSETNEIVEAGLKKDGLEEFDRIFCYPGDEKMDYLLAVAMGTIVREIEESTDDAPEEAAECGVEAGTPVSPPAIGSEAFGIGSTSEKPSADGKIRVIRSMISLIEDLDAYGSSGEYSSVREAVKKTLVNEVVGL
jgi:hypothetical protein